MPRRRDSVFDDLRKFHGIHTRVRSHRDFEERVVAAGKHPLQIAIEQ